MPPLVHYHDVPFAKLNSMPFPWNPCSTADYNHALTSWKRKEPAELGYIAKLEMARLKLDQGAWKHKVYLIRRAGSQFRQENTALQVLQQIGNLSSTDWEKNIGSIVSTLFQAAAGY